MIDMPLMSVREAAALLGYNSEWPVRRLVSSGELRHYRIRGRIRISQEQVAELLEATEVRAPRPAPARSESAPRRAAAGGGSSYRERRRSRRAR